MNHLKQQLLCLAMLASAVDACAESTTSKIIPRSQSFNAARQIVGWDNPAWGINRMPQDDDYYSFNMIFEYTRTFRADSLARSLFGDDLVNVCNHTQGLKISGSAIGDRSSSDWLAEYFGLPRNFQSTVIFKPTISNFILDFSFYAGLDSWIEGMYFRIHGPFVHTKWNLNAQETICTDTTLDSGSYFQGYFSSNVVPVANLNQGGFLSYANGAVPTINNDYDLYGETACLADTAYYFPKNCSDLGDITWQSLCCSKISPACGCEGNGLSRNGFGELRFVLGYNFINDEAGDYHAGLGIYVAAPTGTSVGDVDDCNDYGRYLFEPIVGNGKHWELGAQVTAHRICWRSEDEDKSFGLYIEANVTHLFKASQTRCFDLCSAGSNSRYMLAERLASNRNSIPGLNASTPDGTVPAPHNLARFDSLGLEFANEYAPVANITRSNITSTIGAQGDVAFSFAYQSGNFQWDVGYDFWGRSCEKLQFNDDCCAAEAGIWALKGDQRVYGFYDWDTDQQYAIRIPATDSNATINQGSNMANGTDYTGSNPTAPRNIYGDNGLFLGAPVYINILPNPAEDHALPIYTSEQPVVIDPSDFNLQGTRGISNKIFTHLNYAWPECKESAWTPYIGIGAEVEFGSHDEACCETSCSPTPGCIALKECCSNCALSQWGVWLKVGSSYN